MNKTSIYRLIFSYLRIISIKTRKTQIFFGTNWYTLSAELSLFCFESQDKTSPESLLR